MAEIIDLTNGNNDRKFEEAIKNYLYSKKEDDLLQAKIYYYRKRVEYEAVMDDEEDDEEVFLRSEYGMGFWFALYEYNRNQIILKFIAKCMVEEIFEVIKTPVLEKRIHNQFESVEKFKSYGIRNFIIRTLKNYDETLSGYVAIHTELLMDVEKKINNIINKWDVYNIASSIDTDIIFEILHEFVSYTDECNYTAIELAYYLKYELNIDCLKECDDILGFEEETLSDEEYYKMTFGKKTIQEERVLLDLEKVIYNYIYKNVIPDPYVETEKRKRTRKKK